ncbi:hypothetical protein L211DRAFT_845377 [Terfezia boudieri ATCC MYA-4762]|uniref:Uncharacterized protein n=1 Tax=Terfezia boudieri ATCC MYA-4762 TaxID=1051890 RepID=A0A3N4M2W2_9PEZI|nr:hypothetical protein L211DRAFT_845377 [Terfezia boudieri ATCC MYA-4762]
MCIFYVFRFSCGHFRPGYRLCNLITAEEVQWIKENNDFLTIINNCQDFNGKQNITPNPNRCGDRCQVAYTKAMSNGWRCCDCTLRRTAQDQMCGCGHHFCGIACYALGPDEKAIMSDPYEQSVTLPMEIRPVKRWGSFTGQSTGFRWSMNSSGSDKSSR